MLKKGRYKNIGSYLNMSKFPTGCIVELTQDVTMDYGSVEVLNVETGYSAYQFISVDELVKISDGRNVMSKVKDLLKSKKQKLFEKYVYNGDGIDWDSFVVQKVFIKAFEEELVSECKKLEKEEKDA